MKLIVAPSICSRYIAESKILQSHWPIVFWRISQETDFSEIWDLCGTQQILQAFIIKQIKKNLKTILFNIFKKPNFVNQFGFT